MVTAIIPARGGSKGLPGKNIKHINGKPLISWSIKSALESKLIDEVYVSTEDLTIKKCALEYGAKVDDRPEYLASDTATTIEVLKDFILRHPEIDTLVVLQPTSPIRDSDLINSCIKKYKLGSYTNLATGFFCKIKEYGTHNNTRRQDYKGFFYDDGNVYVLDKKLVIDGSWCGINPCKYPIDRHMNYEIDDEVDFIIVESLLKINKQ
jgi:CMP-N-acetylneuraminic acid synthetase